MYLLFDDLERLDLLVVTGVVTDECVERRMFNTSVNVEITVDIINTDFSEATSLQSLYVLALLITLR